MEFPTLASLPGSPSVWQPRWKEEEGMQRVYKVGHTLTPELVAALDEVARRRQRSRSWILREMLELGLMMDRVRERKGVERSEAVLDGA